MEQVTIEETIANMLHDIVCRISANSALITNTGLKGKTGAAIILYHYAGFYKNKASKQLADNFIEHVRDNITELTSIDPDSELPGIEAGLTYLLKNGFIDTAAAKIPETVQQAVQKNLLDLPRVNIHEYLNRLSSLGKYFTQDSRKTSLTTIVPASGFNRESVSHYIRLLRLLDAKMIPQLNHTGILRVMDVLSRIYSTRFFEKDVQELLKQGLQGLEFILFNKAGFKPFTAGCNPFNIALTLLSIYHRTHNPDFATMAIRLLEEYEGAINKIYSVKDLPNAAFLQHIIACKELHALLKFKCFKNYAEEGLDFYTERKNNGNNTWKDIDINDFSLQSGYAGEGMALLTLEGNISLQWMEDLLEY
jgi:hypothetical protein